MKLVRGNWFAAEVLVEKWKPLGVKQVVYIKSQKWKKKKLGVSLTLSVCAVVCVCLEPLMCAMYEACEQGVCAPSQTARLVRTNEGFVCKKPHSWPLLCSSLP